MHVLRPPGRTTIVQPVVPAIVLGGMRLGDSCLDGHLPEGLRLGAVHEVHATGSERETGTLAGAFAALLLSRLPGRLPILWAAPVCDLYPPGLMAYGLDPGRLVMARTRDDTETSRIMELALREGGLDAVLGEIGVLPRLPAHRLHLACQRHGITAFVLRREPWGAKCSAADSMVVATRWRLSPAPSALDGHGPGAPRWRAELLHARGGREGSWLLEVTDAPHALRVVAKLGSAAPAKTGRRAASPG